MKYRTFVLLAGLCLALASSIPLLAQRPANPSSTGPASTASNVFRDTGTYHRQSITSVDKLSVPGTLTVTAVTEAGSVLTNVARNVAVAANNRYGTTTVSTGAVTPTANQAVRIAFAAVTGADGYDIFLSTAANPLWVGRVTEAQRATGCIISSVGVVSAGGAAGSVDVGIDGTGVASNAAPFTANNAWKPTGITPIDCTGYSTVQVMFKLTVDDLRVLPTIGVAVFGYNQNSPNDLFYIVGFIPTIGSSFGMTQQSLTLSPSNGTAGGLSGIVVCIAALSGTNAKADVWVERIN